MIFIALLPSVQEIRSTVTAMYGVCGHSERRRWRPPRMPKHRKKRRPPKRSLALPDLEQTKSAVLNSLTSKSGQRTYDHAINEFVDWYCSEPRLAFNRTVVLRYRIHLEQRQLAPTTINLRLAAVRRVAYEAADSGLLSPPCGRHPPGQRSTPDWRATGQLAHCRSGPLAADELSRG